jgi:hypothetical protein
MASASTQGVSSSLLSIRLFSWLLGSLLTKQLKPYVSTLIPHSPSPRIPSFSPTLPKSGLTVPDPSSPNSERTLKTPQQYSKWYWAKAEEERKWDILQARRNWWNGMSSHLSELRGDKTKIVEEAAKKA